MQYRTFLRDGGEIHFKTDDDELTLSRVIVWVLAVIFAAAVVYATVSLISSSWGPLAMVWDMGLDPVGFYIAFYACAVLAFTALFFLKKFSSRKMSSLSESSRGAVILSASSSPFTAFGHIPSS